MAQRMLVLRTGGERLALRLPLRGIVLAALLAVAVLALFCVSMTTGSYDIDLNTLLATLTGETVSKPIHNVVWQFRMPRTLAAMLAGGMLALSGASLQALTRNGLADPSFIGISEGAAFVVVGAIVLFPGIPAEARPVLALLGGLAVAAVVQMLSTGVRGTSPVRFILVGVGVSAFVSALTSTMMTYGEIDRAMSALAWLAGSVNAASWRDVGILAVWMAVLMPLLLANSRSLGALRFGADVAVGLGAGIRATRLMLIAVGVALAAVATAIVGPLGFVGLVAPHAASRLARTGPGLHLVLTALCGALLVAASDLVGRSAFAPVQLPAGLITALIGVPIFLVLLLRSVGRSSS